MRKSMRWATILVGAVVAVTMTAIPATADEPDPPANCSDGKPWYRVSQVGPTTYMPIGDPVGEYNDSPLADELGFQLEVSDVRTSTWEVSAGGSLSWGIATVEAKTSFTVSKQSISKRTITKVLRVPGKRWGSMAPKVQYRTFAVDQMKTVSPCNDVFIKRMGKLKAITANPFFSSCVATTECTPKP